MKRYKTTRPSKHNGTNKLPVSGSEPTFTLKPFGTPVGIRSNNCTAYSYQMYSQRPGYKQQPGEVAGIYSDFPLSDCSAVKRRVEADLRVKNKGYFVKADDKCARGFAKIMLLLDPDQDYHFIRQNGDVIYTMRPGDTLTSVARRFRVAVSQVLPIANNSRRVRVVRANTWSHKRGTAFGPELTNAKGQLIFDPRKSSFNYGAYNYNRYCGAYCVKQKPCPRPPAIKPAIRKPRKLQKKML
jgi:LysM repeat protein